MFSFCHPGTQPAELSYFHIPLFIFLSVLDITSLLSLMVHLKLKLSHGGSYHHPFTFRNLSIVFHCLWPCSFLSFPVWVGDLYLHSFVVNECRMRDYTHSLMRQLWLPASLLWGWCYSKWDVFFFVSFQLGGAWYDSLGFPTIERLLSHLYQGTDACYLLKVAFHGGDDYFYIQQWNFTKIN